MIKLNKYVNGLENVVEKIERKIEELTDKMEAIQENAFDEDRDMTEAEWNKFYKLEEQIDELEGEKDEIENALDYLRDYAD